MRLALNISLVFISLVPMGCSQVGSTSQAMQAPAGAYETAAATSNNTGNNADGLNEDGYQCPVSANVTPNYNGNFNNTDSFRVCPDLNDATKIKIHGTTQSSHVICIFPAQDYDADHIYPQLGPSPDGSSQNGQNGQNGQEGFPIYQCVALPLSSGSGANTDSGSSSGVFAQFSTTAFNSVYIVESPNELQMAACLLGGTCPQTWSFGQIR